MLEVTKIVLGFHATLPATKEEKCVPGVMEVRHSLKTDMSLGNMPN